MASTELSPMYYTVVCTLLSFSPAAGFIAHGQAAFLAARATFAGASEQAAALQLPCHCYEGQQCHSNGYCPGGCERGWYGPGCQIGNIAFRKEAYQSSNFRDGWNENTAKNAVDGHLPLDSSTWSCTHTTPVRTPTAWWYVVLDQVKDYAIINVTIVNRMGENGARLQKFQILYTQNLIGNPNTDQWTECAYQNARPSLWSSYTCTGTAIAKRVGIRLNGTQDNILTLCEVFVFGYQSLHCHQDYTGPGCLLHNCRSTACTNHRGTCGPFEGCQFQYCPDPAYLPPDCWTTLPTLNLTRIVANSTCDRIAVAVDNLKIEGDLPATQLLIEYDDKPYVLKNLTSSDSRKGMQLAYDFKAKSNRAYRIRLVPQWCPASNGDCVSGIASPWVSTVTGKRIYEFLTNDSCVYIRINTSLLSCDQPSDISIRCTEVSSRAQLKVVGNALCGLVVGDTYSCQMTAHISNDVNEVYSGTVAVSSEEVVSGKQPVSQAIAIAGSSVGILVVLPLLVATIFVVKRRKDLSKRRQENNQPRASTADDGAALSPDNLWSEPEEQTYGNTVGHTLVQFQEYIKDEVSIGKHFEELSANNTHQCIVGKEEGNKSKNRFQNILPYDVNRVILAHGQCSYINASYVEGFTQPRQYIATQGPSAKTVGDFWNMVWQQQSTIIVMLTDYIENSKKKCEKYFPRSDTEACPLVVTVRSSTTFDSHLVTVLEVGKGSEFRFINHFHFLAWPDHSVPKHSAELLLFYGKIKAAVNKVLQPSGPVIIHCSAGVGRTGAYIALDYLLQQYDTVGRVDVDSCVLKLRDQRMHMVQTKDQYVFLHHVVLYGMKTLHFIFDAALLPSYAQVVGNSSNSAKEISIEQQLRMLQVDSVGAAGEQAVNEDYLCPSSARQELGFYNRQSSTSVGLTNSKRQSGLLATDQGFNAIYSDGCYSERAFISIELPQADKVIEFWTTVYESNAGCIIVLEDFQCDGDCSQYWPDCGSSMTIGSYLVTNTSLGAKNEMLLQRLNLTVELAKKRPGADWNPVPVELFLLNVSGWSSNGTDDIETCASFARELSTVCKGMSKKPVIVQCREGSSHCGWFISTVNALHRLMETGQVQVFHSIDLIRASQPHFMPIQEQYSFIYRVLLHYCDTMNIYANT